MTDVGARNADAAMTNSMPIVVFGAFDRHNFGDLLFPHVAAAMLHDRQLLFAGLAERDLRNVGGHKLHALTSLAKEWHQHPVTILHAGGELLTCDAWQAAVMLLQNAEVLRTVTYFANRKSERLAWAHEQLGMTALAPYLAPMELFPHAAGIIYNAVGGVDLNECETAMRDEVLAKLNDAHAVGVRDATTRTLLRAGGIETLLLPDPAVMVAELFGDRILEHAMQGEVAEVVRTFPQGFIAVQFSVDFSDDRTLSTIAAHLDVAAHTHGLGIVFFRAGAAPWHDELPAYERVISRMRTRAVRVFHSLHLWDICAFIAQSRVYCGSSLHGRIVALAYALPRINLRHEAQAIRTSKQEAFTATWESGLPATVPVQDIARGIHAALAIDRKILQDIAGAAVDRHRKEFSVLCAGMQR